MLDLEARLEFGTDMSESEIERIKTELIKEKRMVMKDWLRNVFLVQGWVSALIGGVLASGNVPWLDETPLAARKLCTQKRYLLFKRNLTLTLILLRDKQRRSASG